MNLGYDAKRIFHNTTGLGNYSRDLVRILSNTYPENRYFLYNPKPAKVHRLQPDNVVVKERQPDSFLGRKLASVWRSKGIVKQLLKDNIHIYHGLTGELPIGIEKTPIKTVVTIHDLIFVRYPQFYNRIDRSIYLKKFRHAIRIADAVVAISEQTKADITSFLHVKPEKIKVIYQGCHPLFKEDVIEERFQNEMVRKYHLPEDFILNVGEINERKNLLSLIKAIEKSTHKLVVVGTGTRYYKRVKNYIKEKNLGNSVLFLQGLTIKEIAVLYKIAKLFVYPSVFEGFGIPIIEALYSKTPVITSKGSCFPEAGGPHTIYINPKNIEELRIAIHNALSNKKLTREITQKGYEYVQRFNDEVIAETMIGVYKNLIQEE